MSRIYICHYGEIGLKGRNRSYFEKLLITNLRKTLKSALDKPAFKIEHLSKRIVITFDNDMDDPTVTSALKNVVGLVHFSPIKTSSLDINEMTRVCLSLFENKNFESFVIRTKRVKKDFPLLSMEISQILGAAVLEKYGKRVRLHDAEVTCRVEVLDDQALLYTDRQKGAGGLPMDSSGKTLVMLSGGIDSPVAAYYVMKRGARCDFIHFHSYPYTKKVSQEKVKDLASVLNKFQFHSRLFMVPFAETQQEIVLNCPENLRVVMYRRFMLRVAETLANQLNIPAIVTGDSLGQVASQTLQNMRAVEEVAVLPVLRPLIGMDKDDIMRVAREIGTFDISALPHDDACARLMPKNPAIRANIRSVHESEKALDIEALVQRDLSQTEVIKIGY